MRKVIRLIFNPTSFLPRRVRLALAFYGMYCIGARHAYANAAKVNDARTQRHLDLVDNAIANGKVNYITVPVGEDPFTFGDADDEKVDPYW